MDKILVIWRRMGDTRDAGPTFDANPQKVDEALLEKAQSAKLTPQERWRWWKWSDDVLVELAPGDDDRFPADVIYYLPRLNWVAMWKPRYRSVRDKWDWYVHIGITRFEEQYGCWVFTDLLTDVLINDARHTVLDLDDLADCLDERMITAAQASDILRDTQALVNQVEAGLFPPKELRECHQAIMSGYGLPVDVEGKVWYGSPAEEQ